MSEPAANPIVKSSRGSPARTLPLSSRLYAALAALACLAVLSAAASITPSSTGFNTHTQLGLPPCMWAAISGKPCPTCGMTTAFAHAAHADLLASIQAQPFGAFLALLTAMLFWLSLHTATTGSRALSAAGALFKGWTWWVLGIAFIAAWLYKMSVWQG
jgi:hypothetical protein